jgi:hypothetical protein
LTNGKKSEEARKEGKKEVSTRTLNQFVQKRPKSSGRFLFGMIIFS